MKPLLGAIGSVSLVFDEWWGTFVDMPSVVPPWVSPPTSPEGYLFRLTAGVHIIEKDEMVSFDELRLDHPVQHWLLSI